MSAEEFHIEWADVPIDPSFLSDARLEIFAMPLPKRKKGESKQEHASRTIQKLRGEGYGRDQAVAIGLHHAKLGKRKK